MLTITNRHRAIAPAIAPGLYVGYFVNEHGEQSIYTYDHDTRQAFVYSGDMDWRRYDVRNGVPVGLILTETERDWLRACWRATGGQPQP